MSANQYTRSFFASLRTGVIRSAEETVPLVLELIPARSVVDVGCGEGAWLAAFSKNGVSDVLGIDGDYVDRDTLQISRERFQAADLSKPLEIGRTFDLAVSMEVAEHLPAEAAATFVESRARLAPVVLFSAAIPLQGGSHHINEQWPDKWADPFKLQGYLPLDCIHRHVWKNETVEWWYAQNTLIFVRTELLKSNSALREEFERTSAAEPRNYVDAHQPVQPPPWNTQAALRLFFLCLWNAIRRRVDRILSEKPGSNGPQNPRGFNSVLQDGTSYEMVKRRNGDQNA